MNLGATFGRLWETLGDSGGGFGETLGRLCEASGSFGRRWGSLWEVFGRLWEALGRFSKPFFSSRLRLLPYIYKKKSNSRSTALAAPYYQVIISN